MTPPNPHKESDVTAQPDRPKVGMSGYLNKDDMTADLRDENDSLLKILAKLQDHAKAMSDALIKVRPLGGSELFVKVGDAFYADPKFCGDCIEKLRSDLHNARIEIERLARSCGER
jgi:hypothetical protein